MREADFERLFSEHAKPLFSFLVSRCGDRGLAEDVLADTFERALRARTRFDRRSASETTSSGSASPFPWGSTSMRGSRAAMSFGRRAGCTAG
jgi:DNA-directed RNA polymerase specialized sigma24 family protein